MPTYLGYDVFQPELRNILSQDIVNEFEIRGLVWQKQSKVAPQLTERILQLTLVQQGAADRAAIRDYFKDNLARVTPFWIESGRVDYRLALASFTGEVPILVDSASAFNEVNFLRRHVALSNGQRVRVIAGQVEGQNSRLTLLNPVTSDLSARSSVSNLFLVRFETDTLAIDVDGLGSDPITTTCVIRLRELQGETP